MNTLPLMMDIEATLVSTPLNFRICIDDKTLYDEQVSTAHKMIEVEIPDSHDYSAFTLKLELYGKTDNHSITEDGVVMKTASVVINSLSIDGLELINGDGNVSEVVSQEMMYTHDFNGTSEAVSEIFTHHMGCNGVQSLDMYTPMHMWLYEKI
jgi:hypothetical protein